LYNCVVKLFNSKRIEESMSSITTLTVFYDNQKKIFKGLTGNTSLQQLFNESYESFGLPPSNRSKYCLKHRGKAIAELAQPLRFCSFLSNNSQLDLCLQSGGVPKICKVALTATGTISVRSYFSSFSLLSLLTFRKSMVLLVKSPSLFSMHLLILFL
jgi:hypothetical protein